MTDPGPEAAAGSEAPPAPRRGLPYVRLGAGLALVLGALAFAFWPRPARMELACRFEPESPAPGQSARLWLSIAPGPGAPGGAEFRNVRVVVSGPADVEFARNTDFFLDEKEEVPLDFTVTSGRPGEREIVLHVEAQMVVGDRALVRPVVLRRRVKLTVGAPEE